MDRNIMLQIQENSSTPVCCCVPMCAYIYVNIRSHAYDSFSFTD